MKPFYAESELQYEWSIQDQNQLINVEDSERVIRTLEAAVARLDEGGGLKAATFLPLSLSSPARLDQVLRGRGAPLDSVWVGLSVSHYLTRSLHTVLADQGSLTLETPLFLLLVDKQLLEAFRRKVAELADTAGFVCDNPDYDVMRTFSVAMTKKQ